MQIDEIVLKLIGPVQPIYDDNVDAKRLENLKELINVIDTLLFVIDDLVCYKDRPEAAARRIGSTAKEFIESVKDM